MTVPASITPSPKPKRPLWRRLVKWTLRIAVVFLVLGITAYAIANYWAAKTINTEIARIRAAGEPLTFEDLDKLNGKVDHAQDAGPYYLAAEELVDSSYANDDKNYNLFLGRQPLSVPVAADALAWAHKYVDLNTTALELLDRGSALPGCNADIQLQYGIAVALPRLGRARDLTNAASLRTRLLTLEGHGEQAVESVRSTMGLLRLFDRQPVMVDALVQIAILSRVCSDSSVILNNTRLSPASLQRLGEALVGDSLVQPSRMFTAERVYTVEIMRNLISVGIFSDPLSQGIPTIQDVPTLPEREQFSRAGMTARFMFARSLPTHARLIAASSGDWPKVLTAIDDLAKNPASIWDEIEAPALSRSMFIMALAVSSQRSTQIAIQIERYRLAHNQYPATLNDLPDAASFPKDPFTGNPLLYVKTPDGYCVMSAGRNRPEDDSRHIDRDADPIKWSERWGIHIRTQP